jgi:hypothetical protein
MMRRALPGSNVRRHFIAALGTPHRDRTGAAEMNTP